MPNLQGHQRSIEFPYVHGFSPVEQERLARQARFLEHKVYQSIEFNNVDRVLEVGCGVGAQTEILLRRYPDIRIAGIDFSEKQLAAAHDRLRDHPLALKRLTLQQMDAGNLDFAPASFDAAFLCWILEHVPDPEQVLAEVRRVLKPGSRLYATEVMNAAFFLSPYSPHLQQYWAAFNEHQLELGGDPFIGAKLGHILLRQGFRNVRTEVKTLHLDGRDPHLRHEVLQYWSELLLSATEQLLAARRVTPDLVAGMKLELQKLSKDPELVFFYCFFQATATL
ncbi:class I SAM-dependent methyltransferase [Paludibacterium yongneupense]|uniref:class I SAM-dependent methyltransferase n=1 Tax=Paludibacterium yongneupense TaxID=400061 RepID=UPI000415F6D8|nr:class I SAM-dependent methyltransferase [Paludibacterium yongneupense]